METVSLVKKIYGYDTLTVSIFTPYRGTVLQKIAVKNGWLVKDHITVHTTSSTVLKMPPPYLNRNEIDTLMKMLPLYVYFPYSMWEDIQLAEQNNENGKKLFNKYSKIYKDNFYKEHKTIKRYFMRTI